MWSHRLKNFKQTGGTVGYLVLLKSSKTDLSSLIKDRNSRKKRIGSRVKGSRKRVVEVK
jgi:hypothetical protein